MLCQDIIASPRHPFTLDSHGLHLCELVLVKVMVLQKASYFYLQFSQRAQSCGEGCCPATQQVTSTLLLQEMAFSSSSSLTILTSELYP